MRNWLYIIGIALMTFIPIMFIIGVILSAPTKASDVYFCGENILCVDMYELLPQDQLELLFQLPYMLVFQVDEDLGYLHMEIDTTQLGNITVQDIAEYLDSLEFILRVQKAQTTIYPDAISVPMCIRDESDGGLNGIYNVGNNLFVVQDDSRCFGVCDDICMSLAAGGNNEVSPRRAI